MLGRALGCKCKAGGALYYAWFTYVEACAWMQVHSWRRPSPPLPPQNKDRGIRLKSYSVSACSPGALMVWMVVYWPNILVWREREGAMKLFGLQLHFHVA